MFCIRDDLNKLDETMNSVISERYLSASNEFRKMISRCSEDLSGSSYVENLDDAELNAVFELICNLPDRCLAEFGERIAVADKMISKLKYKSDCSELNIYNILRYHYYNYLLMRNRKSESDFDLCMRKNFALKKSTEKRCRPNDYYFGRDIHDAFCGIGIGFHYIDEESRSVKRSSEETVESFDFTNDDAMAIFEELINYQDKYLAFLGRRIAAATKRENERK